MNSNRGQTTIEMIIVIALLLILFTMTLLMAHSKSVESNDFKLMLDAKRYGQSVADNINAIAEQGPGYYRFFSLPEYLFGSEPYDIVVYANFVEINWSNRFGDQSYVTQTVTANITQCCLEKNMSRLNKVFNYDGRVFLTCNRSDLRAVEDSFDLDYRGASRYNISFDVLNYGVSDAGPFWLNLTVTHGGAVVYGPWAHQLTSGLGADRRYEVETPQMTLSSGNDYNLSVRVDSLDEVVESCLGDDDDNWFNMSFTVP